jgi:hypothetical protein
MAAQRKPASSRATAAVVTVKRLLRSVRWRWRWCRRIWACQARALTAAGMWSASAAARWERRGARRYRWRAGAPALLMLRRAPDRGDFWHWISGAPQPGESDREAAVREVLEETGLDVAATIFALG